MCPTQRVDKLRLVDKVRTGSVAGIIIRGAAMGSSVSSDSENRFKFGDINPGYKAELQHFIMRTKTRVEMGTRTPPGTTEVQERSKSKSADVLVL